MSDNDDETKPDMTRIEDLSEYLHEDDPETDAQLDTSSMEDSEEDDGPPAFETMSLDDLEEDDDGEEALSENEEDVPPSFETSEEDSEDSEEATWGDDSEDDGEDSQEATWGDDSEDDNEWAASGDSDDDNEWVSEEADFSSDSTQPDIEIPAEFTGANIDEDASDELEEVQDIEEEAQLQEEVENEIQEALDADEDNDAFAGDFTDDEDMDDQGTDALVAATVDDIVSEDPEEEESVIPQSDPGPVIDVAPEVYDSPTPQPERSTPRENFQDINEFGNAISYGNVSAGGNPPFSIILRRIKYLEDSERIVEILRDHGLCDDSSEADYRQGLNNGSMLISQLSEYSAIYLAHKFRRFDLEILVGLADEIHPSKNYDMDYKGLVRKENLRQNKSETMSLEDKIVEVESILLATTPTLENYKIDRYLGVVSTHVMIDENEFQKLQEVDTGLYTNPDELLQEIEQELAAESETSKTALVEVGLEEIYKNLAEALKVKAYKLRGNAVVGINYQITPLINQKPGESTPTIRYKISCTGNAVWVGGKEAPRSEA